MFLVLKKGRRIGMDLILMTSYIKTNKQKSQGHELTTFHEELQLIIQESSLKLRQRPSNEQ